MPEQPQVSITVVTHNSASCVATALASVRDDIVRGFAEAIVVDNASPDDSVDVAKQAAPEARIIRSDTNRHFAGGCNLAWPHVRGRYWLLLNPDVVVPRGGLRQLVDWMDAHPELGAATPSLVDESGAPQIAAWRFPAISRTVLELLRGHLLMPARQRQNFYLGGYWRGGEHLDVDWVLGASLIARRAAVERAGLLSEELPMYAEDSEWCWRIHRSGFRIGLMGGTAWRHDGQQSASRTWSDSDRLARIWRGVYAGSLARRGRTYTSALWLANLAAFAVEALHPRRTPAERARARAIVRAHRRLAERSSSD